MPSAPSHNDPKLLYAIEGINAYHIANGVERSLTPSAPQTLSLLMVPTSSSFADPSGAAGGPGEEDFYLHLHLPPELDLPLPATTQIYHQPPTSYLIPRWDLGPDSGAFTRIEFPPRRERRGIQEDIDTFETILAQCTAFLERAPPPKPKRPKGIEVAPEALPPYNPADYASGQGYVRGSHSTPKVGQLVLVDEEDGSVIGGLADDIQLVEDGALKPGCKDPVEISLPASDGGKLAVRPASPDIQDLVHPAYKKSSIVNRAHQASRLLITSSNYISSALMDKADSFTRNTRPAAKPITFKPATHAHIRRINSLSSGAAGISSATVGAIGKVAQNFGASVARHKDGRARGYDRDGNVIDGYKPGVLNKSLMAFNTVLDGMEQAGRNLLTGTSSSVTTVVGHRWGPEVGDVAKQFSGGFKNVALVYIDVAGVSRRTVLKSVGKGMVVGRVQGGGDVIVGESGDLATAGSAAEEAEKKNPHAAFQGG